MKNAPPRHSIPVADFKCTILFITDYKFSIVYSFYSRKYLILRYFNRLFHFLLLMIIIIIFIIITITFIDIIIIFLIAVMIAYIFRRREILPIYRNSNLTSTINKFFLNARVKIWYTLVLNFWLAFWFPLFLICKYRRIYVTNNEEGIRYFC